MKKNIIIFGLAMVLLVYSSQAYITNYVYYDMNEGSGTVLESSWSPQINATLDNSGLWSSAYPTYNISGDGAPYSLNFSSGNYAATSNSILSKTQCVSLWINTRTDTGAIEYIGGAAYDGVEETGNWMVRLLCSTTNNFNIVFWLTDGANNFLEATNACDGNWHNYVFCINSTGTDTAKLYKDGVFTGSITINVPPALTGGDDVTTIGKVGYDNAWHYTTASIDEVGFYNYTLNSLEVKDIYNYGTIEKTFFSYPSDDEIYNNYNGTIDFTTGIDASCVINNTNWINQTGYGTEHSFLNSTPAELPNGNYDIQFNCTDNINNSVLSTLNFILDITNPTITPEPLLGADNYIVTNGTFTSYINYTDDNLYFINVTIYNNTQIFTVSNLEVTHYQYNISEDVSIYPLGMQDIYTKACDGHTLLEKAIINNKITVEKISFDDNKFSISAPDATKITLIEEKDRYRPVFEYEKILPYKTYYVESEYKIEKVKRPDYKGHFVILELEKWIDFEDGSKAKVEYTKISDYKYEVKVYNPSKKVEYNSVGSLNCVNVTYQWENRGSLNITAKDAVSSIAISNFTITVNGTLAGSTTNGHYYLQNLSGDYSVNIDARGYEDKTVVIEVNETYQTYNFSLFTSNSLNLSFYNAQTLALLSGINVTMIFIGETAQTNTTSTGSIYVDSLSPGNYTFVYSAPGYRQNQYLINITNRTTQDISLYLNNESLTSLILIEVQDRFGTPLSDVEVTIQRYSQNSWITEQIIKTDFQGRSEGQFVLSTVYYNFILRYLELVKFGIPNNNADKKLIYAEDVTNGLLFTIDTSESSDWSLSTYHKIYGLISNLTYINLSSTGGYFYYHYDDINNNVWTACLEVKKGGSYDTSSYICNCSTNNVTSESSTLTCYVNQTTGREVYTAVALMKGSGPFIEDVKSIMLGIDLNIDWGVTGYLIGFLLVLLSYFLFLKVPVISLYVGTGVFALLISLGLMFKDIGYTVLITLLVITYLVANIKSESGING